MITSLLALAAAWPQDVEELIRRLGAESLETRDAATVELERRGEAVEPALRRRVDDPDPEIVARVKHLLRRGDRRRLHSRLASEGLPERWLAEHEELLDPLLDGKLEELPGVLWTVRGRMVWDEDRLVDATAPLAAPHAAPILNAALRRVQAIHPNDDDLKPFLKEFLRAAIYIKRPNNDVINEHDHVLDLDIPILLALLPPGTWDDLEEFPSEWQPRGINTRLLRAHVRWESVPADWVHEWLMREADPERVDELIAWADADRPEPRWISADLMGRWKTDHARSVPVLRRLWNDPDARVRAAALRSLAELEDEESPGRVRAALDDRAVEVRIAAMKAAELTRPASIDAAVLRALGSESVEEQLAAAEAAGRLAVRDAGPLLLRLAASQARDRSRLQLIMDALPLTGWPYRGDDLMTWASSNVEGVQAPPLPRRWDCLDPAMILSGSPPAPDRVKELHEAAGLFLHWDRAMIWTLCEGVPEGIRLLDPICVDPDVGRFTSIVDFRAAAPFVDWTRHSDLVDRYLRNPSMAVFAYVGLGLGGYAIPEDRIRSLIAERDKPGARESIHYLLSYAGEQGYHGLAPVILDYLKTGDPYCVEPAIRALGRLKYEPALEEIVRLVEAPNGVSARTAGEAIGRIGVDRARGKIVEWLGSDQPDRVVTSLHAVKFSSKPEDRAVIRRFTKDPRDGVRAKAVGIHLAMADPSEGERLAALAFDPSTEVRRSLFQAAWEAYHPALLARLVEAPIEGQLSSDDLSEMVVHWLRRGAADRARLEPLLRKALTTNSPLTRAAVTLYLEEGWPKGASLRVRVDGPLGIAARLDAGDARALPEALLQVHTLYAPVRVWRQYPPDDAASVLLALHALLDRAAYERLKGIVVERGDPDPLGTLAKSAGLKLVTPKALKPEWPSEVPRLSAREILLRVTRDKLGRVAPLIRGGELRFVPWNEAIQFWRSEHLRRAQVRNR